MSSPENTGADANAAPAGEAPAEAHRPWHVMLERDTRTLYALAYADAKAPYVATDDTRKHDAAYDCEVQAKQVTLAWGVLRANRLAAEQAMLDAVHAAAADTL